ncbi:DUF1707 SHOCT-like domain-containing protein [Granulicoccus sp. GXG6511]|uniref:DUF1707 SHOCT-like domain-containing protein n=1 Tax=Granulicoccus sp. GXG6511 TaxID=3381351 RepID=UPI003D7EF9EC
MSTPEPSDVGPKFGGDMRVSDSDRDQVMTVLSSAYAEGRLTKDEHDERLAAATSARTFDDLVPLTRDLVPLHAPIRTNVPAHQPPGVNVPQIDRHSTGDSMNLIAVFGGSSRKGVWRVRRKINSFAMFGGSDLDFTEAIFEHDVIEITGFWMFGGLDIKIPEGVEVDDEVVGIFGGSDVKNTRPVPGGPKIVLKGIALFGGVSVKGPKTRRT